MQICQNCGAELHHGVSFCPRCLCRAAKTPVQQPVCRPVYRKDYPPSPRATQCLVQEDFRETQTAPITTFTNPKTGKAVKKAGKLIAIVLAVAIALACIPTGWFIWNKLNTTQSTLSASDNVYVEINECYTDKKIVDTESAIESLNDVAEILGISDAQEEFTVKSEDEFVGCKIYRLAQEYKGIPVYGRDVVVIAAENGKAYGLTSNYLPVEGLDTIPKITETQAKDNAIEYMSSELKCENDSISIGSTTLNIYFEGDTAKLVWVISVSGYTDDELLVYELIIDAKNGNILNKISQLNNLEKEYDGTNSTQTINVAYSDETKEYSLTDEDRSIFGLLANNVHKKMQDGWDTSTITWKEGVSPDASAVDAMKNIELTYDFFKKQLERVSYDNEGGDIIFLMDVYYYEDEDLSRNAVCYNSNIGMIYNVWSKKLLCFSFRCCCS
jgi:Zn-dependent metalloprotease